MTGSSPPDVCGTAEYTVRLCDSLRLIGIDALVFYRKQWGLMQVSTLLGELRDLEPDLLHIQYPTTGYGHKLGPQGIATMWPSVVTFHEASQAHLLRQMSLYPFLLRGLRFVFTNEFERHHVSQRAPWINSRSTTIPIGANIPVTTSCIKLPHTVTCFSIIRPHKGLEDVIELARLLHRTNSTVRVRIIGALMERWSAYYNSLREKSACYPIDWHIGLNDQVLPDVLGASTIAYLPFPDGASERRSSLITMLMNRVCVLTTVGPHTPPELMGCTIPVSSPQEAVVVVQRLMKDVLEQNSLADKGVVFARRFDWKLIAERHQEIYQSILYDLQRKSVC